MEKVKIHEYGSIEITLGEKSENNITPLFYLFESNKLSFWDEYGHTLYELPDWLADGIRELVKNKIEQENNRGA